MTTPAAYLAHYPLSAALKAHAAGDPLPRWELHPVDVEAARPWADMLHTLRRLNPRVAFPGPADTDNPQAVTDVNSDSPQAVAKIAAPDERTANVSPVEQPAGEADPPTASPANPPDEGDPLGDKEIEAARKKMAARSLAKRQWISDKAVNVRINPDHGGKPTVRRFELFRGLHALALADQMDDDMIRGIIYQSGLQTEALDRSIDVTDLIAMLDVTAAKRFALIADTPAARIRALSAIFAAMAAQKTGTA